MRNSGTGGDVNLQAQEDIIFDVISTASEFGRGGDVVINSRRGNVRGLDAFVREDTNSDIGEETIEAAFGSSSSLTVLTFGAISTGDISISTGSGNPFVIGDPSVNGTAGDLTTNRNSLEPDCIDGCNNDDEEEDDNDSPTDITIAIPNFPDIPEVFFDRVEAQLTTEFVDYLPIEQGQLSANISLSLAQRQLNGAAIRTGRRPALIYAVFGTDGNFDKEDRVLQNSNPSDPLELLLVTAEGDPIYVRLPEEVTRSAVTTMVQRFRRQVYTPHRVDTDTYLKAAQQLYDWLIPPQIEAELKAQGIDTISFITDVGLRSIPLAALHDGQQFIIENYNVGLMPSLSLTDFTYQDLRNVEMLVGGASSFADQTQLPGVPIELASLSSQWEGAQLQEDTFTLEQLLGARQESKYGILHLATHGEFAKGELSESYIQLYDQRLGLDKLRQLGLHRPAVELITLSACETALGNFSAELGFAGFAVLTGAKTAVASLWRVSDEASAALMIEFYRQLQSDQPMTKVNALRKAQLAMLRGNIFIQDDQLIGPAHSIRLPLELITEGRQNFSHPYYWAAFSLVGSPW